MIETEFIVRAKNGKLYKHPVKMVVSGGRIVFPDLPFALKDEIKAMGGAKWDHSGMVKALERMANHEVAK